jgi:hypothetical protein
MERTGRKADPSTDELVRFYRSGRSLVEIEAATGVGRGTVERRLKAAGIVLRPAGWPRPSGRAVDPHEERLEFLTP